MKKLATYTVESAGTFITQYWYSYKQTKRYQDVSNNTNFEQRLCETCKNRKRFRIMKSHNTKDCRFKGNKSEEANEANRVKVIVGIIHQNTLLQEV